MPEMSGPEVVLSILASVIVALIGVVVSLVMKSQTKFEARMEKHVHDLRDDVHLCSSQIMVLKTILVMQLPEEVQGRINQLSVFKETRSS